MGSMEEQILCVPGQRLSIHDDQHVPGGGTYTREGYIYSALAGMLRSKKEENRLIVDVIRGNEKTVVPSPGAIVTCKVQSLTPRYAKVLIIAIGETTVAEPFRGMVRREDIRATEKDKTEVNKSFRPGDIVLARVLSIGDAQFYVLTTAENELGVSVAYSEAGESMIPVSWSEMQCPKTFVKEHRKVAKIVPEDFRPG